jgi:hypothetical protein
MGRRQATFPDDIAEAEQRYAQVLRDIRDVRGETQQALGRLLDWSDSMVSGSKRRPSVPTRPHTGATARWPQPMNCASGQ